MLCGAALRVPLCSMGKAFCRSAGHRAALRSDGPKPAEPAPALPRHGDHLLRLPLVRQQLLRGLRLPLPAVALGLHLVGHLPERCDLRLDAPGLRLQPNRCGRLGPQHGKLSPGRRQSLRERIDMGLQGFDFPVMAFDEARTPVFEPTASTLSGSIQTHRFPAVVPFAWQFPCLNRDRTLFVAIPSTSAASARGIRTGCIPKPSIEGFEPCALMVDRALTAG